MKRHVKIAAMYRMRIANKERFQKLFVNFGVLIKHIEERVKEGATDRALKYSFDMLIKVGGALVRDTMELKAIPSKDQAKFNKVAKLLLGATRAPNKPTIWWEKNGDLLFWFTNAFVWPVKETGAGLYEAGPFTLLDSTGSDEKNLETLIKLLKETARVVKSAGVPKFEQALYGNVSIADVIGKSKLLAYYDIKNDTITVKRKGAFADMLHAMIHELGHRHIRKGVSSEQKRLWTEYHYKVGRSGDKIPYPKVGETLGIPLKGGEDPIVTAIVGDKYFTNKERTKYVPLSVILKAHQAMKYPTAYASTDPEEHFCEALAFYVLNKLDPDQRDAFERIFIK